MQAADRTNIFAELRMNTNGPDVLQLQWWLLPDQFAFIPWFAGLRDFHFRLLVEQSKASHDIAAQIEKVSQMTEMNSAAAEQAAGAAARLESLAEAMRATVNRFKI